MIALPMNRDSNVKAKIVIDLTKAPSKKKNITSKNQEAIIIDSVSKIDDDITE